MSRCVVDLSVQPESPVSCQTTLDCPAKFSCSEALGKCIANDNPDKVAPGIAGLASVTPPTGKAGTTFSVSFTASEVLGIAPVIVVHLPSGDVVLEVAAAGATYTGVYTATGLENAAQASVDVTLIDAAGNASSLPAGVLSFDFSPPTVATAAWTRPSDRSTVRRDELVGLEVSGLVGAAEVSAALRCDGQLVAESNVPILSNGTAFALFDLARLDLPGTVLDVAVLARDEAGNSATLTSPQLVIDTLAPGTLLLASPADSSLEISPSFEFQSDDASASFLCQLDGTSEKPCTSPLVLSELSLGQHALTIVAIDGSGNRDPSPLAKTWTITRQWLEVSAGRETTCAVATDHTAWCWGRGSEGQLGNGRAGPQEATNVPTQIASPLRWRTVRLGFNHACGIAWDGSLWCWGNNAASQLGLGDIAWEGARKDLPTRVGSDHDWIELALARTTTCAIREGSTAGSGSLYCWGETPIVNGPTVTLTTTNEPTLVSDQDSATADDDWLQVTIGQSGSGDAFFCGVRRDDSARTVWCWGTAEDQDAWPTDDLSAIPRRISALDHISALSASDAAACALRDDDALFCWGYLPSLANYDVEQVFVGTTWSGLLAGGGITAPAGSDAGDFCLTHDDGKVYCFGVNETGVAAPATVGQPVSLPQSLATSDTWQTRHLSVGRGHACAVSANGTLRCWGLSNYGQLGVAGSPTPSQPTRVGAASDWTSVVAGETHTCATRAPGSLWCWGDNARRQVGNNSALNADQPVRIGSDSDWHGLSAGYEHTCGLRGSPASLWCWGDNTFAQSERPNSESVVPAPSQVGSSIGWQSVSAGRHHGCGLYSSQVWCWGSNTQSELGLALDQLYETRTRVGSDADWTSIASGRAHTCGTRGAGNVYCWGSNTDKQAGHALAVEVTTPTAVVNAGASAVTGFTSVAVGEAHSCGLKNSGEVYCWGTATHFQLENYWTVRASAEPLLAGGPATNALWVEYNTTCRAGQMGYASCFGQLGVSPSDEWVTFASGKNPASTTEPHRCAINAAGELYCWGGENRYGELGTTALWLPPAEIALPAP